MTTNNILIIIIISISIISDSHPIIIYSQQLMQHSLIVPLIQQRCNRVLPSIPYDQHHPTRFTNISRTKLLFQLIY